jgi:hypothetical protein
VETLLSLQKTLRATLYQNSLILCRETRMSLLFSAWFVWSLLATSSVSAESSERFLLNQFSFNYWGGATLVSGKNEYLLIIKPGGSVEMSERYDTNEQWHQMRPPPVVTADTYSVAYGATADRTFVTCRAITV